MNTPEPPENSVAEIPPPWDPILVRDLVRHAQATGEHPAQLELGRLEAAAFRTFLSDAYGEDGAVTPKDTYYLGLEVVLVDAPSKLTVGGAKSHDAWDGGLPPLWTDRPGQAA